MSSVNKVILIGNTGKDAETRHLEGGSVVSSVSLACSESYKDKSGNKQERTEWVNLVFWGKLAEVVEKHVVKGTKIYVEGRLRTEEYNDKNGEKRYTTKVYVNSLTMLGSPKNDNYAGNPTGQPQKQTETIEEEEYGDLPF